MKLAEYRTVQAELRLTPFDSIYKSVALIESEYAPYHAFPPEKINLQGMNGDILTFERSRIQANTYDYVGSEKDCQ